MEVADLAAQASLRMAYAQKKGEAIVTGLEKPINDHLPKLWGMPGSDEHAHGMTEVTNWLDEVCEIILKPDNRQPSARFYFRILFNKPFGGAETTNIASRLRRLQGLDRTLGTTQSVDAFVKRLYGFHAEFAARCHRRPLTEDEIKSLILG